MDELQKLYDSEINLTIGWFWDGGIDVTLGDKTNGIVAESNFDKMTDVVPWLQDMCRIYYPHSTYTKNLEQSVR